MEQLSMFSEPEDTSDVMPSNIPQRVQYGDIWQMGEHKLLSNPPRKTPAFKHGDTRGIPFLGLGYRGTTAT